MYPVQLLEGFSCYYFNSTLLNCLDSRFIQVQGSNNVVKLRKSYDKIEANSVQKLEEMFNSTRTSCGSWYTGYQWKDQTIK